MTRTVRRGTTLSVTGDGMAVTDAHLSIRQGTGTVLIYAADVPDSDFFSLIFTVLTSDVPASLNPNADEPLLDGPMCMENARLFCCSSTNAVGCESGAVYAFSPKEGDAWGLDCRASWTASTESHGAADGAGPVVISSLAVHGDKMLVGYATKRLTVEDDSSGGEVTTVSEAGCAHVYERDEDGNWMPSGILTPFDFDDPVSAETRFGQSVALTATHMAVGSEKGVFCYRFEEESFVAAIQLITPADVAPSPPYDFRASTAPFGLEVCLLDDALAFSSPEQDVDPGHEWVGAAHAFQLSQTGDEFTHAHSYTMGSTDSQPEGADGFGRRLLMPSTGTLMASSARRLHVFRGTAWTQTLEENGPDHELLTAEAVASERFVAMPNHDHVNDILRTTVLEDAEDAQEPDPEPDPDPEPLSLTPGDVHDVAIHGASTGSIGATEIAGGTPPYSATWHSETRDMSSVTSEGPLTQLAAGSYEITVTDAAEGVASHEYVVGENPQLIVTPGAVTNVAIHGASTGSIGATSVAGGTGRYTYEWEGLESTTGDAQTGLTSGTYRITVTDDVGATAHYDYVVFQNDAIVLTPGAVTNVEVHGRHTGRIGTTTATGGNGVFSYAWQGLSDTDASAKTGLAAGEYTLTVTDSVGGTASHTFEIAERPAVVITPGTVTNVEVNGAHTGRIGATSATGGDGNLSFAWQGLSSTDGTAKTGLGAGRYTVTVSDGVGGTASHEYVVTERAAVTITPGAVTNVAVHGAHTGRIGTTTASGGDGDLSYSWQGLESTDGSAKTDLAAGTFTVTVNDGAGGTASHAYTVTESAVLHITPGAVTDVSTRGAATGAIAATTASGGTGSYTASWTTEGGSEITSQTLSAKSGLRAGTYTVSVDDGAAPAVSHTYTVSEPSAPVIPIRIEPGAVTNDSVYGNKGGGSIKAPAVTGGTGDYEYSWSSSPGATDVRARTTAWLRNVKPGKYQLTVTDGADATASHTYAVKDGRGRVYRGLTGSRNKRVW